MPRMSQRDLGRKFARGATEGNASNVHIHEGDEMTMLVGYGWAVYAHRDKSTGEITAHRGWFGYSPSTSAQMTKLGVSHPDDNSVPEDAYVERADDYSHGEPKLVDL